MAVLTFQENVGQASALVQGEDYDRSGVVDDVATGADTAGLKHLVDSDRENGTAVDLAGRKDTALRGVLTAGGFGHNNNI